MPAEQARRLMPICEACFIEDHTRWEPESMDETGSVMMKLVGIDVPKKINIDSDETCCMCGVITIAGIFEMFKPSEVYFSEDSDIDNNFEMSLGEPLGDNDEGF